MVLRYTVDSHRRDPCGQFVAYADFMSAKAALRVFLDRLSDVAAGQVPAEDMVDIARAAASVFSVLAAQELFGRGEDNDSQ